MSASNYLEEQILKHTFNVASFTNPTTFYVSLHTGDPGETGASNEVVGGSYARLAMTPEYVSSSIKNDATLNWSDMPAATITHFAIFDDVTAGNCLVSGSLTSPITIGAGASVELTDNGLTITAE